MTPRVSVIIPAYNSADVLPIALQSVADQTFTDWEIVVADDASSDDTADVAEAFSDRVKVVRTGENTGPAGARNRAIAAASGELLAPLDADDYWHPNYLESQVALYDRAEAEEPGVGIVTCDAELLGPDGIAPETLRQRVPFPEHPSLSKELVTTAIHASSLVPRRIVEEVGGFSPNCFGTEDHDLWVKVLERGYRAVGNPEALVVYRQRGGSVSSDNVRLSLNRQKVYRNALERGNLNWFQRRLAHRELRLYRLIVDVGEMRVAREKGEKAGVGRVLRTIPLALAVGAENPQRWARVIGRMFTEQGSFGQRLNPGRDLL